MKLRCYIDKIYVLLNDIILSMMTVSEALESTHIKRIALLDFIQGHKTLCE